MYITFTAWVQAKIRLKIIIMGHWVLFSLSFFSLLCEYKSIRMNVTFSWVSGHELHVLNK